MFGRQKAAAQRKEAAAVRAAAEEAKAAEARGVGYALFELDKENAGNPFVRRAIYLVSARQGYERGVVARRTYEDGRTHLTLVPGDVDEGDSACLFLFPGRCKGLSFSPGVGEPLGLHRAPQEPDRPTYSPDRYAVKLRQGEWVERSFAWRLTFDGTELVKTKLAARPREVTEERAL